MGGWGGGQSGGGIRYEAGKVGESAKRWGTVQLYIKVWLTQCDLYLNWQSYKVDGGGGVGGGGGVAEATNNMPVFSSRIFLPCRQKQTETFFDMQKKANQTTCRQKQTKTFFDMQTKANQKQTPPSSSRGVIPMCINIPISSPNHVTQNSHQYLPIFKQHFMMHAEENIYIYKCMACHRNPANQAGLDKTFIGKNLE